MNYQRIYDQLITRAKARIPPEGYIEHHHIIPRCMNGSDDKENIAILTPEEHFIAHVLLVKIHPEIPELIVAVSRMCKGKGRKRRRLYGWLRRRHAEYMKKCQAGANNSGYGMIWIHRDAENKRIKKEETIPEGWEKGRSLPQLVTMKFCKECKAPLGFILYGKQYYCDECKKMRTIKSAEKLKQKKCENCGMNAKSQTARCCDECRQKKYKELRAKRKDINFPKFYGPYACKDGFERFVILYSENNRKSYTRKTLPSCWNWQTEGS